MFTKGFELGSANSLWAKNIFAQKNDQKVPVFLGPCMHTLGM